jgi:8-oxo-dGTP diphosphatase
MPIFKISDRDNPEKKIKQLFRIVSEDVDGDYIKQILITPFGKQIRYLDPLTRKQVKVTPHAGHIGYKSHLSGKNIKISSRDISGPFKVSGFDPETGTVKLEGHEDIVLGPNIPDKPTVGYNYAFYLDGNKADEMMLLTVDSVITNGKSVLLIKRKGEPYAGYWALPGGFIEPGETAAQAAARETSEEAGISIDNLQSIGIFNKPGRDPRMQNCWSHAFKVVIPKQQAHAGDDASATQWVPIEKLKSLQLAFDHASILKAAGLL